MNNKVLVGLVLLLVLPMASAQYYGNSVYDGYNRYYNPYHQGFYEGHDFQQDYPRINYDYPDSRRYYNPYRGYYNPYQMPNSYKLDYFRSIGYYDPDEWTEEEFERCYYFGDCHFDDDDEEEEEDDRWDRYHRYRQEALSIQRGSYEYFRAGYHAASNQEIAFKKGYNDGYYGKEAYFDDDHELTTWYRKAYLEGWYTGLEDRHRYDHPG